MARYRKRRSRGYRPMRRTRRRSQYGRGGGMF
nr:MAG TPA: hypothetical protein [Caudoviricetes sp.]